MADEETKAVVEVDEPMFDPSLKKKKKKKAVVFDPTDIPTENEPTPTPSTTVDVASEDTTLPPPPAADAEDLDFSELKLLKKKKKKVMLDKDEESGTATIDGEEVDEFADLKKKKKVVLDVEDGEGDATTGDAGAEEFADLKKKKKKVGKKAFDMEAFEKELAETEATGGGGGSDDEVLDVANEDAPEDGLFNAEGEPAAVPEERSKTQLAAERKAWLKESDRDYSYDELLGRFYQALFISHPSLSTGPGKKRYTVPPPVVQREGNKRSIWANVGEICKKMHRQPEHVIQFLFAELGTNGSVDGQQNLVIKGRFQQKQIENVLRRYIVEYVTCKTCKSPDTLLEKDNRLYFVTCETCGSKRSVTAIKTGFSAQIGKRKATQK